MRVAANGRMVVAAAIAGLVAMAANAADYDYRATPLTARDFAPLTVGLPGWKVFESSNLGSSGKLRLADPTGDARMLEVSWAPGDDAMDNKSMAPALVRSGLVQLPSIALQAPLKGMVLRFATPGETKRLAMASLYCKSSNTTVEVVSFLNADWADTVRLIERILGSVHCRESSPTEPIFPRFEPRNGYKRVASSMTGVIYANAHDDMILFSNNQPPRKSMTQHDQQVAAFKLLFERYPGLRHLATQNQVHRIDGKDIVFGEAENADGSHVFLMATWWQCERPQQAFYGAYLGADNPSATNVAELLANAQCP